MFTGLVEACGRVSALEAGAAGGTIAVEVPWRDLVPGESIAVDGCCLTALAASPGVLRADLSAETLARTTLGALAPGREVHLERALRVGDRLGGHVVLGHVDGVERVVEARAEGEGVRVRVSLAAERAALVVEKGSITIDGVSLTIAALGEGWLEVALVPATLAATRLGRLAAGDRVNVELDVVGKQVARVLGAAGIERAFSGAPWEPQVGYCRAVRAGDRIHVSGTAPVEPDGTTHAPGDAYRQARRCFEIVGRAVEQLGGGRAVVVRTRLFVTDATRWEEIGRAHAEAFGAAPPACTLVEVSRLIGADMLVEVEAEAWLPRA